MANSAIIRDTHPTNVMTPECWLRVKDIYHAVCELAVAERAAFLAEACGADADLRREVESLLAEDGSRAELLDGAAITVSAVVAETHAGARLGPYRIEASIGKGGMGEVWRARDTRLNRDVAIKISAQQFTDRFEREARAIAALNHSNICTIHDVGPNYLVMELVEGPTLAERIRHGPIPMEEALAIAKQIADALEAAHEKGIVHRDLKPANIKIRPDGSVKVLDFGLAKAAGRDAGVDSETQTMTTPGMIMGTPCYMSPEQARGEKVDKRADIWAFGVVLYEMVTGKRLFEEKSVSETLAAVIREEPDWERAPVKVRRLLRACLEKDPRRRLRDAGDMERLLDTEPATTAPSRSRFGMAGLMAAGVFALIAIALAFVHFREKPPETTLTRLIIPAPDKTRFTNSTPVVSPDGRQLVFVAVSADGINQLWLRPFDSPTARALAGTEKVGDFPFWSPDSRSIAFYDPVGNKLKKLDLSGGLVTTLADAFYFDGGTWNQDGVIVFGTTWGGHVGLQQVSAAGGGAHPVTQVDPKALSHAYPWFLPDGKHFLYMAETGAQRHVHIASLESSAGDRDLAESSDSFAIYSQGYLILQRGNSLVARPFDAQRMAFTGEESQVFGCNVGRGPTGNGFFSVSTNGVMLYRLGTAGDSRLTWLDRTGNRLGTVGEAGDIGRAHLSPDGKTAAVTVTEASSGHGDIWLYDVSSGRRTRFTSDPVSDVNPSWSPDGRTIVFHSTRAGKSGFYRKRVDGTGDEELIYTDNRGKGQFNLSPDGKYIVYATYDSVPPQYDLWTLPVPPEGPITAKPTPFMQTPFNEFYAHFSPDGHWISYESKESGIDELVVAPFPPTGLKRVVSLPAGASHGPDPKWRADGKELFYAAPGGRMMAAQVDEKANSFEVKKVEPLFMSPTISWDVSADGQRFLMVIPDGDPDEPLTVVQNWTAGLKK